MEKVKIAQAAKMLGVSLNSVYRKVKQSEDKLNDHLVKENGVTLISSEGIEILRGLFARLNPSETMDSKETQAFSCLQEIIGNQQKIIENLMTQQAEDRQRQAEERERTDTIIMKLTHDVGNLQKVLEEKPVLAIPDKPLKVFTPWEPAAKKAPKLPVLKKLWYELINPAMLRAN